MKCTYPWIFVTAGYLGSLACAPSLVAAAADANAKTVVADDWSQGNLIKNGDFSLGSTGTLPNEWQAVAPNPALAPAFLGTNGPSGKPCLYAVGNGRQECFGFVRQKVRFAANKTYRFRVRLRFEGFDDLNQHVVLGVFGDFNNGIFAYRRAGDWVIGENRFGALDHPAEAEVRLYFRYSATGRVWWDQVSLQECDPIPPRLVKLAVSWGRGNMEFWGQWLDFAAQKKVDLALLPETFNGKPVKDAEPLLEGPTGRMLAQKALAGRMYVSGSYLEKRGDMVFNSAPLFDREGKLVGVYSKNQLYDPEADDGITPGVGLPVFTTDFGKVGIMICYDSWFPETARLLAYKGAEIILFPNAAYFTGLMPARAADNGVCLAVSTLATPAGIWDSSGAPAGEEESNPTRFANSSIVNFETDEMHRMLVATVDLNRKFSPHNWGGPMRSAPGGRRVRQTLIQPLEAEIATEARRWWEPETAAGPVPNP